MQIETGKDLVSIIHEGKIPTFTKFYTLFFQRLMLASDKYVKDISIAEEIVQNVFLKIWENPESLEDVKSVRSYLYRAVINASINHVNRQKSIAQHHEKIAANLTEQYLMDLEEENELIVLLYAEIDKLPPQCQKVFKLNRFEHLKYKEIAELLNISERTVENHIALALKTLRSALLDKKPLNRSVKNKLILSIFLY